MLIINHIFKKIEIHYFYYLVAFLVIITGHFREFLIFSLLIIIHELGHGLAAMYYGWEIDKIIILPFGGLSLFKASLNRAIKEEFLILISGPILQIIFYILASVISPSSLLTNYHYAILFFNLIPIIPLDGSKLINLFFNVILPFKLGHKLTIFISFIVFILIIYYIKFDILLWLILIFLLIKTLTDLKKHNYIFNKFLLERYLYNIQFRKTKVIKGLKFDLFFRDFSHVFKINNSYYKEYEKLSELFDKDNDL